jgi:hypothetical protein
VKHTVIVLGVVLSMVAFADSKKRSRSVIAAEGWLKSMTDPAAIAPMSYDKTKPLAYTVQSDPHECTKLASGKAVKMPEINALKACFVATWRKVAKEATLAFDDMRPKDLDGDQTRWAKTAPKGTTWVAASRRHAGQDLTVNLALGPDYAVLAVWFVYLEHDGE